MTKFCCILLFCCCLTGCGHQTQSKNYQTGAITLAMENAQAFGAELLQDQINWVAAQTTLQQLSMDHKQLSQLQWQNQQSAAKAKEHYYYQQIQTKYTALRLVAQVK